MASNGQNTLGDYVSNLSSSLWTIRPLQFISEKDKDEEWHARNIDYFELYGLIHIGIKSQRQLKNYKLIAGVLDKMDYSPSAQDDMFTDSSTTDIMSLLKDDDDAVMDLKFYPLIPLVINTLLSEAEKRNFEYTFKATDEESFNEYLKNKKEELETIFLQSLQADVLINMMKAGMSVDANDPNVQQALQAETEKRIAEYERYFNKDYKTFLEEFANKLYKYDTERLNLKEKIMEMWKDYITTSSFFCEMEQMEDDYHVNVWNPLLTFYRLSGHSNYIQDAEFVGKVELMHVSEVIDKYGAYLCQEDIDTLKAIIPNLNVTYLEGGRHTSAFYDYMNKDNNEVQITGGIDFKRMMFMYGQLSNISGVLYQIFAGSELGNQAITSQYLRVTKVYWVSQRKVGILTRKLPNGEVVRDIVDESFIPQFEPEYDETIYKEKSERTLLSGDHVEWVSVNEIRGGIKIGANMFSFHGADKPSKNKPIYIGIGCKKPGRIRHQLRRPSNIYSCKLPVFGMVLYEKGVKANSLVDLMKPYQIGYNIVNNQIMDMLLDEIGSVLLTDDKYMPTSMDDSLDGMDNISKLYTLMKKFNILPLNTSDARTPNPLDGIRVLSMEHSGRLQTRIALSQYFKAEMFNSIGLTPERMGKPLSEYQSAKSVEISLVQSYGMTEKYFISFFDNAIPKFHELRTNLCLSYMVDGKFKPSMYIGNDYEREILSLQDDKIALREVGVMPTTGYNYRLIIEQIKQVLLNNPNLGADIDDIFNIIPADTYGKLQEVKDSIYKKQRQQAEIQKQLEQESTQRNVEMQKDLLKAQTDFKKELEEMKKKYDVLIAQIRSSFLMARQDMDGNNRSDLEDYQTRLMAQIQQGEIEKERAKREQNKLEIEKNKIQSKENIEQQKMAHQQRMKEMDERIAQIYEKDNKNPS